MSKILLEDRKTGQLASSPLRGHALEPNEVRTELQTKRSTTERQQLETKDTVSLGAMNSKAAAKHSLPTFPLITRASPEKRSGIAKAMEANNNVP